MSQATEQPANQADRADGDPRQADAAQADADPQPERAEPDEAAGATPADADPQPERAEPDEAAGATPADADPQPERAEPDEAAGATPADADQADVTSNDKATALPLAPDAFMRLRNVSSPLMYVLIGLVNLLAAPLPMTWMRRFVFPYLRSSARRIFWTRVIIDGYLVLVIGIEALALYLAKPASSIAFVAIAIYGLWDLLVATLRDLLINPSKHRDKDGHFLLVQDPIRWFALFPTAPAQAVICFAILYVHFANDMGSTFLADSSNALYYSLSVFLTLGSEVVTPENTSIGQVLVGAELLFFVTILTAKLPLAIALTRAKGGGGAANNG
ncbi:ion channel [Catellatospora sichuanensis]|uniref:ion channel n=1 Tax=Catellatospora sichuanensis TaxID=1969805 RepID=UPI001181E189|nr:ion channel [Catellatospora sichuanensis]